MKNKLLLLLSFLFCFNSAFSQNFTFTELESMIGGDFQPAENYLLQNSNWESAGEAETIKGIRLKYRNSKRKEQSEIFNLVDLYKSEEKEKLIAISIQFKSQSVYQQYLRDLTSKGYKVIDQIKEKKKYARMYQKGKMKVITELKKEEGQDGEETKTYFINILTNKKYK